MNEQGQISAYTYEVPTLGPERPKCRRELGDVATKCYGPGLTKELDRLRPGVIVARVRAVGQVHPPCRRVVCPGDLIMEGAAEQ